MTEQTVIYIYGLGEPGTGEIRYIGKTDNLHTRFLNHLLDTSNTPKGHWIQSVVAIGKQPVLQVLETLTNPTKEDWIKSEQFWISHFRTQGFQLTNLSVGGEGCSGYHHTEESKLKISQSLTGKPLSIEHKAKLSEIRLRPNAKVGLNKGEINGQSKLTNEQAEEIRVRYVAGNITQRTLAKEYNVSLGTINQLVTGRTWKHLSSPTIKNKPTNERRRNLLETL